MEMTILYLFFCTGEEQQGPGMLRLTTWSHPPQAQRIYSRIRVLTLGSNLPGKMSAGPEGMHFFIKWSKTNQMGRCVQHTKGRHLCPVPAMEAYRECCHCPLTPHSSSTSKMGEHSHLRASAPPFYPWYGEAMWLQSSQI